MLGVGRIAGLLQRVGADWCLAHGAAQDWVVRLSAVVAVDGASGRSVPEVAWSPIARLGLARPYAASRTPESGVWCTASTAAPATS